MTRAALIFRALLQPSVAIPSCFCNAFISEKRPEEETPGHFLMTKLSHKPFNQVNKISEFFLWQLRVLLINYKNQRSVSPKWETQTGLFIGPRWQNNSSGAKILQSETRLPPRPRSRRPHQARCGSGPRARGCRSRLVRQSPGPQIRPQKTHPESPAKRQSHRPGTGRTLKKVICFCIFHFAFFIGLTAQTNSVISKKELTQVIHLATNAPIALKVTPALTAADNPLKDIRLVNGKTRVDLTAVHEYEKGVGSHLNGRPMPHWKHVTLIVPQGPCVNGGMKCEATIDRLKTTIYLASIPPEVAAKYNQYNQLEDRIKKFEADVQAEQDRLTKLDRQTPRSGYGSEEYVNRLEYNRLKVDEQIKRHGDDKQDLSDLKTKRTEMSLDLIKYSELAYNTGKKLQGADIWDIGVKIK